MAPNTYRKQTSGHQDRRFSDCTQFVGYQPKNKTENHLSSLTRTQEACLEKQKLLNWRILSYDRKLEYYVQSSIE